MWVDTQHDGRHAEWLPLQKFRNSILCTPTMPQSLADACCWSAMSNAANIGERKTWT